MAANTHGLATLTYGNPTCTGYVVQSSTITSTNGVNVVVEDENGLVVFERKDDDHYELTLDAVVSTATPPNPGTVFTYNSIKYITDSVDVKRSNKDVMKVTIKGHNSESVSLT